MNIEIKVHKKQMKSSGHCGGCSCGNTGGKIEPKK